METRTATSSGTRVVTARLVRPCTAGNIGRERREIECEPVADPAPAPAEPAPTPGQPAPA